MKHFVLVLLFLVISTAYSQKDSTISNIYKLSLKDGSFLIGELIKQDTSGLKFKTLSGIIIIIQKDKISSIELIDKNPIDEEVTEEKPVKDGEYFEDPSSSRLFLIPTAKSMKSGDVSFSTYELYFPSLSIGIQDIVTLSIGRSIIPGSEYQIFYFAPKITPYQGENISFSVGGIYLKPLQEKSSSDVLFYGLETYGNKKASLTAGVAFGGVSEEVFNNLFIIIGGDIIFSENLKLITENWINLDDSKGSIISLGFRFFTKKLSADLGFARFTESS